MFGRNALASATDATSQVNGTSTSRRRKLGYMFLGCALFGLIIWLTSTGNEEVQQIDQSLTSRNGEIGGDFAPIPRQAPPPVTPVAATPGRLPDVIRNMTGLPAPAEAKPTPIALFQAGGGIKPPHASAKVNAAANSVENVSMAGGGDRLDEGLGSGKDGGTVAATMLPDRHLFMTMGTPIPCTLEQPINTMVPGPFRCKVRGPIYSTSGAVPLLDDGTWAFGRIANHLERGMDRAFAVISRLETPQGCLVKLRASLGDQLGTPGVEGDVDTHFFERFRGVAMIALLDAAGQAAAIGASRAIGGETGISFNQFQSGTRDLAQGSFGDDTNIPSTLRRAQATSVLVMPVDDIDMRQCFSLRTTN